MVADALFLDRMPHVAARVAAHVAALVLAHAFAHVAAHVAAWDSAFATLPFQKSAFATSWRFVTMCAIEQMAIAYHQLETIK